MVEHPVIYIYNERDKLLVVVVIKLNNSSSDNGAIYNGHIENRGLSAKQK